MSGPAEPRRAPCPGDVGGTGLRPLSGDAAVGAGALVARAVPDGLDGLDGLSALPSGGGEHAVTPTPRAHAAAASTARRGAPRRVNDGARSSDALGPGASVAVIRATFATRRRGTAARKAAPRPRPTAPMRRRTGPMRRRP